MKRKLKKKKQQLKAKIKTQIINTIKTCNLKN